MHWGAAEVVGPPKSTWFASGLPLRFLLLPGQASDISNAQVLLDQIRILGKQGRPRKRCRWLLAEKS
ncbi:hypothetical protein A9A72_124256 [Stutzerimonas stutzeri]|jgi:hypothetical protein|uniref:Uncharacterized protein n=1 Tax=Stutzerimonas stutzeri TaxID=316 RepID=A0A5S5B6G5_STUST|nr:hypothetical protein A9A72_124256 [Stutzerimonas stutzeri]